MPDTYTQLLPPVRPSFYGAVMTRTQAAITFRLIAEDGTEHGTREVVVPFDPETPTHVALAAAIEAVSDAAKESVR